MKKVYIAMVILAAQFPEEEESFVAGVFSTRDKAIQAGEQKLKELYANGRWEGPDHYVDVIEFTLDEPKSVNCMLGGDGE